jgi:DNA-binding response OmpR family regulator
MSTNRLQGRNVLIVDDDEDILSSMDLAIRAEGATTMKATDGSAAVLCFQAGQFDIVVLDMMLPKSSGFVVLEKIMEREDRPPVIMITANQGKRHMQYAQDHGVTAYLTKPVPLQRLVETVVRLVDGPPPSGKTRAA